MEEYESDLLKLRLLVRQAEPSVKFVQTVIDVIQKLFNRDLCLCLQKQVDIILWETMKELVSELRKAKDNTMGGFNICIGWLMNLFHTTQYVYDFENLLKDAPSFLVIDDVLLADVIRKPLEPMAAKIFTSFITLRLGDLFRYKNELDQAVALYHFSIECDAVAGSAWNQLAIIAQQRVRNIDELHLSTRALLCDDPFEGAAANITAMLKKYTAIELDEQPALQSKQAIASNYLALVARFHFLLPVTDSAISMVVPYMTEVKFIVPMLAILDRLGDSDSNDEASTRSGIISCLQQIASNLEKTTPACTDALCLLLRVSQIRFSPTYVASLSQLKTEIELADDKQLEYFKCLIDPFTYPVTLGDIISVINERSTDALSN